MKVLIKRNIGAYSDVGEIDVDEIHGVFWDNVSGGVHAKHAGYAIYGYIDYNLASQLVSCSGTHAHYGNPAKIMIPASLNKGEPYREGYRQLVERCVPKPAYHARPVGLKPCTKRIIEVLKEKGPASRGELRRILLFERYSKGLIARALNHMGKDGRIVFQNVGTNVQKQILLLP